MTCGKRAFRSRSSSSYHSSFSDGWIAALHQDLVAAQGDRLLDLLVQLLARQDVGVGVARLAVEGAEVADRGADVGVVDVAVDVVGAVRLRVQPRRDGVRRPGRARAGRGTSNSATPSSKREPAAVSGFRQDAVDAVADQGRHPRGGASPSSHGQRRSSWRSPASSRGPRSKWMMLRQVAAAEARRRGRAPAASRWAIAPAVARPCSLRLRARPPSTAAEFDARRGPPRRRRRTAARSSRSTPGRGRRRTRKPGRQARIARSPISSTASVVRSSAGGVDRQRLDLRARRRTASAAGSASGRRWSASPRRGRRERISGPRHPAEQRDAQHRAAGGDGDVRDDGVACRPRKYSTTGIRPTSSSPAASRSASRLGRSSDRSTSGAKSVSRSIERLGVQVVDRADADALAAWSVLRFRVDTPAIIAEAAGPHGCNREAGGECNTPGRDEPGGAASLLVGAAAHCRDRGTRAASTCYGHAGTHTGTYRVTQRRHRVRLHRAGLCGHHPAASAPAPSCRSCRARTGTAARTRSARGTGGPSGSRSSRHHPAGRDRDVPRRTPPGRTRSTHRVS